MKTSIAVYKVNKGINQSIEFKGLKAQYIWYLGGGLLVLLIVFAILYIIGISPWVCLGLVAISGPLLVVQIYKASRKYGQYGLMKALARRRLPSRVVFRSRGFFTTKTAH